MKPIIKEIFVIILLCLAICLIFCVIFYNYLPNNIVVPSNVEAYTTSSSIKNEINEEVAEYPKQNIVFEITDSDLTLYKQSQSYDPGKANPFATAPVENTTNDVTTGAPTTNTSTSNNSSQSNTQTNNGTFFEDTKLK